MSETEVMTKNKLMKKYSDLVWLARSTNDTSEIVTLRQEVRDLYPKETVELEDQDSGEWHHGFNSGMLACLRLLSGGRTTPGAMEEFPMLDS